MVVPQILFIINLLNILFLADWLKYHKITALFGVDTRAITKKIREKGAMLGKVTLENQDIPYDNPNLRNLVCFTKSGKSRMVYGISLKIGCWSFDTKI